MKAEDLFNQIIAQLTDKISELDAISKKIESFITDFEKFVRKDQDRITRHTCAEDVNKLAEPGELIPTSYAYQAIMNANTIKKEFKLKLDGEWITEESKTVASKMGMPDLFDYIKLDILPGFTDSQISLIKKAVSLWNKIIIGGSGIGLRINFYVVAVDGIGAVLGAATPTRIDPVSGLPITGIIGIDKADLEDMEQKGTLFNVIVHEIAHVLGFGTIWEQKGLLILQDPNRPLFTGENAIREYSEAMGAKQLAIPVENQGSDGTRNAHWKESIFKDELMTGFVGVGENPLSRMTIASLEDLGYSVNYRKPDRLSGAVFKRKKEQAKKIRQQKEEKSMSQETIHLCIEEVTETHVKPLCVSQYKVLSEDTTTDINNVTCESCKGLFKFWRKKND